MESFIFDFYIVLLMSHMLFWWKVISAHPRVNFHIRGVECGKSSFWRVFCILSHADARAMRRYIRGLGMGVLHR